MRNPGMIVGGVGIFVLGLFLISPVADWLLSVAGGLAIVAGLLAFAAGVWNAARKK